MPTMSWRTLVPFLSLFIAPILGLPWQRWHHDMPHDHPDLHPHGHCTPENMSIRREWGVLTRNERLSYISATKCLMQKPSIIPPGIAPGALSRYDDFIATHINYTLAMHADGIFLTWHRQFIHLYEKAMREECGYEGTLPYWNWSLSAHNLSASPLFDGSDTSLSGDGEYDPNQPVPEFFGVALPTGSGGGCVTTGPFANRTSPFQTFPQDALQRFNGTLPSNALEFAPHCFRRSLNNAIASNYTTQSNIDYLLASKDIAEFQNRVDFGTGTNGVHPAGHDSLGPDLFDIFSSPSDPAFFLHHSMIDLLYSKWQAEDPRRFYALSGGSTTRNIPPSANVTLGYVEQWGYLGEGKRIGELMDIKRGEYCYEYEY